MLDFVTGKLGAMISAGQFFNTHARNMFYLFFFLQKLNAARMGIPSHTLLLRESHHSEITMRLFTNNTLEESTCLEHRMELELIGNGKS